MKGTNKERSNLQWPIGSQDASASILGVLFAHYIHQNELMYSRCNIVIAVQGATIAAGWFCGQTWGMVSLLAGAFMTVLLWLVLRRDRQCRNANLDLMKCIENSLLPGNEWIGPGSEEKSAERFPTKIRVGTPAKSRYLEAGRIYTGLLLLLVGVDIVLAILAYRGQFGGST